MLSSELSGKTFVLYSKRTHKTGKALATALGCPSGQHLPLKDAHKVKALLRYGSSQNPALDYATHSMPTSQAIATCVDRFGVYSLLRNVDLGQNVITIPTARGYQRTTIPGCMSADAAAHRWRIYRPRRGERPWGRDIQFLDVLSSTLAPAGGNDFVSVSYVPALFELRVHVVDGVSRLFQVKIHEDHQYGEDLLRQGQPVVRSREKGWKLIPLSNTNAKRLGIDKARVRAAAKSVATSLGTLYAAIDFMLYRPSYVTEPSAPSPTTPADMYFFLEANSGPGLDEVSVEQIAPALVEAIKNRLANGPSTQPNPSDGEEVECDDWYDEDGGDDLDDHLDEVYYPPVLQHLPPSGAMGQFIQPNQLGFAGSSHLDPLWSNTFVLTED